MRQKLLSVVEAVGVGLIVTGVARWFGTDPALILSGLVVVAAVEVRG